MSISQRSSSSRDYARDTDITIKSVLETHATTNTMFGEDCLHNTNTAKRLDEVLEAEELI